jgi:hypothetical protein
MIFTFVSFVMPRSYLSRHDNHTHKVANKQPVAEKYFSEQRMRIRPNGLDTILIV